MIVKINKKIIVTLLVILISIFCCQPVKAYNITQEIYIAEADGGEFGAGGQIPSTGGSTSGLSWDSIKQQADSWLNSGKGQDHVDDSKLQDIVIPIGQMLVAIGGIVLLVVTTIMGIKYMTGGPEKRGQLKQQLVGLVVATIVIFAAQFIWALAYTFMTDITVSEIEQKTIKIEQIKA